MRNHYFVLLLAFTACGPTSSSDGSDQLDPPAGKADAASTPSGAYTNATPAPGAFTTLTLNADHTFTRGTLVECAIGVDCPPLADTGRYLFTHSTTSSKHFIRFYAADGTDLDRYEWKLSGGTLELTLDSADTWFTMTQGATCASAGGTCVPLVPDACEFGSIGDATEYSCGGGTGVECCLPPQAPACQADSDCTGALPQYCQVCADGSTACAHWSCASNACAIVSCAN